MALKSMKQLTNPRQMITFHTPLIADFTGLNQFESVFPNVLPAVIELVTAHIQNFSVTVL